MSDSASVLVFLKCKKPARAVTLLVLSCVLLKATSMFAASEPLSPAPSSPEAVLKNELRRLEVKAAPGVLGVAIIDAQNGRQWGINQNKRFPLMSVMKVPIAATVLALVDAGRVSLDQKVSIDPAQRVPGSAVPSLGDRLTDGPIQVTIQELLHASVSESDNTAADALLRLVGGAETVTRFLADKDVRGLRVDTSEGEMGVRSARANQVCERLPAASLSQCGLRSFTQEAMPNPSTPFAAATMLTQLRKGKLLSRTSSAMLTDLMMKQTVPNRLRSGLPPYVQVANKTGTGGSIGDITAAWNDIGIVTWPNGKTFCVAVFLKNSTVDQASRDGIMADVARAVSSFEESENHPEE